MLSILIPIYNHDVHKLVKDLVRLCDQSQLEYEIICFDDHSAIEVHNHNYELAKIPHVQYKRMEQNKGRSAIRNLLVKEARFENLLFIDCDMQIINDHFIERYLSVLQDAPVIFGGSGYTKYRPKNKHKLLRWKYGKEREMIHPKIRNRKLYLSLKTCNLLIKKTVFSQISFDEKLHGYGYEDTLFGIELCKQKVRLLHIDNPLLHHEKGIEETESFLKQTFEAIKNLYQLIQKEEIKNYLTEMPIVKYYHLEKKLKLEKITLAKFKLFKPVIIKNLNSSNPNLRLFDFYRLGLLLQIDRDQAIR